MTYRSYLLWLTALAAATPLLMITPVHSQDSFFKGKTMHIIVGALRAAALIPTRA